jgi:RHS repeat-associated protein
VTGIAASTSTYDANDRVSGETFDSNGDQLTRDGKTQSFDSQDRLTSSTEAAKPSVHVYYDGDGNRVAVDVGGALVSYLIDDQNPTGYSQVVEERVGGAVTRAYVFGRKALSKRDVNAGGWIQSYYEQDGHGSVVALTDAGGVVTDTWEYDAFGTVVARTGATPNSLTYSGEWFDSNQGLQYLRARWYSPGAGRFVSADTVQTPDGAYRYTRNNPVTGMDPTGHEALVGLMMEIGVQNVLATLAQPGTNSRVVLVLKDPVDVFVDAINEVSTVTGLVDDAIKKAKDSNGNDRAIAQLTIQSHGITAPLWETDQHKGEQAGLCVGNIWTQECLGQSITKMNFSNYRGEFERLRPHFGPTGAIFWTACWFGDDEHRPLMQMISSAAGVPVLGTSSQNKIPSSWSRGLKGDLEVCGGDSCFSPWSYP